MAHLGGRFFLRSARLAPAFKRRLRVRPPPAARSLSPFSTSSITPHPTTHRHTTGGEDEPPSHSPSSTSLRTTVAQMARLAYPERHRLMYGLGMNVLASGLSLVFPMGLVPVIRPGMRTYNTYNTRTRTGTRNRARVCTRTCTCMHAGTHAHAHAHGHTHAHRLGNIVDISIQSTEGSMWTPMTASGALLGLSCARAIVEYARNRALVTLVLWSPLASILT